MSESATLPRKIEATGGTVAALSGPVLTSPPATPPPPPSLPSPFCVASRRVDIMWSGERKGCMYMYISSFSWLSSSFCSERFARILIGNGTIVSLRNIVIARFSLQTSKISLVSWIVQIVNNLRGLKVFKEFRTKIALGSSVAQCSVCLDANSNSVVQN